MAGIGLDVTGRLIGLLAVFSPQRGRSDDSGDSGATVGVRIDHLEVSMSAAVYADFVRRLHTPAAVAIHRALQRNVRKFRALAIDAMPEAGPDSPAAIFRRLVDHVVNKCSSCEAWQPQGDAAEADGSASVPPASVATAALPECVEQFVAHGIHDAVCGVARVDRDADRQLWARCLALRPWMSAGHVGLQEAWLPSADTLASIHASAAAGDGPRVAAVDALPAAASAEPPAASGDCAAAAALPPASSDCGAASPALDDDTVDASDKDAVWLVMARTLRAVPVLRSPREKVEALVFVNRLLSRVFALHVAKPAPVPPPGGAATATATATTEASSTAACEAAAEALPVGADDRVARGDGSAPSGADSPQAPPASPGFAADDGAAAGAAAVAALPATPRRPVVAACTADDLVPALALALAHCCPPSFASSLAFIAAYRHDEKLRGEAGFVTTLAQSACHVLVSMDASTTPGWTGGADAWQAAVAAIESALATRWLPPPDAEEHELLDSAGAAAAGAAAAATPLGSDGGGGGAFSPMPAAAEALSRDAAAPETPMPLEGTTALEPVVDAMHAPPPPLPLQLSRFPLQHVPLSAFAAALVPPVVAMSDDHLPEALTAWLADRTALTGLAAAPASSLTLQDVRHLQEEYCHLAATVTSLYALLAEHGRVGAAPHDARGEVVEAEVEAREEEEVTTGTQAGADVDDSVEVTVEADATAAVAEPAPVGGVAAGGDGAGSGSGSNAYDDV